MNIMPRQAMIEKLKADNAATIEDMARRRAHRELNGDYGDSDFDPLPIIRRHGPIVPIRKTHVSEGKGWEFICSDETEDRYGDSIMQNWEMANFLKDPISLFNHDQNFPIGFWEGLAVQNGALRGWLRLAPEGTSDRIDEIRRLVEANILRSVSVGFRPLESKPMAKGGGTQYLRSELVECSLVSVPANPNAVAVARSLDVSRETLDIAFAGYTPQLPSSSGDNDFVTRQMLLQALEMAGDELISLAVGDFKKAMAEIAKLRTEIEMMKTPKPTALRKLLGR